MSELSPGELRAALLSVLVELHDFCIAKRIPYYLYAGTLLGAVRHGGFIPWDDDADVLMDRADFERFCSEYESNAAFSLLTRTRHPTYPYASAKLALRGTLVIEEVDIAPEDRFGVSVDIFPYDPVSDRNVLFRLHCALNWAVRAVLLLKVVQPAPDRAWWTRGLLRLSRQVLRGVPVHQLTGARERVARLGRGRPTQSVAMLVAGTPWRVKRAIIEPAAPIEFCKRTFLGPADPHALLTAHYGDYMTPPPEADRRPPHRAVSYRINEEQGP